MTVRYNKMRSVLLGRDMEYKVYGDRGKPLLALPGEDGRFYEFENRLINVFAPYIDEGRVQVFAADDLDRETILEKGDPAARAETYDRWLGYIISEAVPVFSAMNTEANGWEIRFAAFGVSSGALHAANLFFRYPDVFDALMGIGGVYSLDPYFAPYRDARTDLNSPVKLLGGMDAGHPFMEKYRRSRIVLCSGTGPGEEASRESTLEAEKVLREKYIPVQAECWDDGNYRGWDLRTMQAAYFLPGFLRYD